MSETCTMGGADGYILGVVFGLPFVVIAVLLNIRTEKLTRFHNITSAVITACFVLFVGSIWLSIFVSTVINGNHICGQEYNSYISDLGTNYWYLPVFQLSLLVVLIASVIKRVRA